MKTINDDLASASESRTCVSHSKGPWEFTPARDGSGDFGINPKGERVVLAEVFCAIRYASERAADEAEANAKLIAAAPRMYEYIANSASNGCAAAKEILEAINGRA